MSLSDLEFSDLFLSADPKEARIRKLSNSLVLESVPDLYHPVLSSLYREIFDFYHKKKKREFSFVRDNVMYRISVMDDIFGPVFAVRMSIKEIPTLESCGIHEMVCRHLLDAKEGLIVFAGGFGTGKTTAAFSLLKSIAEQGKFVLTLEDPPEIKLSGVVGNGRCVQIQIDRESVDKEVEYAMRMAFDALFISEIRTPSVAREVINASVNGKLIVSTIHADSAVNAVMRLTSIASRAAVSGAEKALREMLGAGLVAIVFMDFLPTANRRAAKEYLIGSNDVCAKISANEIAGLQNAINMTRNRLTMGLPLQ